MEEPNVTTNEIMDFLKEHMVVKGEFVEFKGEFNELKGEFNEFREETRTRFDQMNQKINQVKLDLIDHIDDKLADLKGDLVALI
jgi:hypothetical protein